ncbi:MAG: isochorismate synthase [Actinobacteria bacterium]|nr:isochorismate synthase [Actinomycetota bacterium]
MTGGTEPGPLVARARRIDGDHDLVDVAGARGVFWSRDGVGFAGRGVAATIEVPAGSRQQAGALVATALGAIRPHDAAAPPPLAVGALPYDPDAPARLIVPAVTVWRTAEGARWLVTVGDADAPEPGLPDHEPEQPGPRSVVVEASRDPDDWCDLVARATARIRSGGLDKVVLARELLVTADRAWDPRPLLRRLRTAYPACHVTHVDGFLCASPELLVARRGDLVRAQPMAGTAPRVGDPVADARLAAGLLADPTYRREHQLTIDMVHDTLLPWCSYLDAEPEPSVVAMANVQHLATTVEGRLSAPEPSVLDLVHALHPTPAVGGTPRHDALAFQQAEEQLDRRRYAGAVGWVDATGCGEFAVSVRCAELDGAVAHVYAGCGIVADSDPRRELAETQAKLQALLGALVRV